MASSKPRSQGGGRKANSEPRQQVFRDFGGCNFQLSPREFSLGKDVDQEQSDLQMNYVVIQNNAEITSNKTIETRNSLVKIFDAPVSCNFTDACLLVGDELYIGMDDGSMYYGNTYGELQEMTIDGHGNNHHTWGSLAYVDNQIIATTYEHRLFTGDLGSHELSDAILVPNPVAPTVGCIVPHNLSISTTLTEAEPYRVAVAWSYINKFGPTKCSDMYTFYASMPVDEWSSVNYVTVRGQIPIDQDYGIEAVEVYYTVGNSSSLLPAGRTDDIASDGSWSFDWFGYLDSTSMWPIVNLLSPTENYTKGVRASKLTCIDGRMYFWGYDEPYRLYIGGNPGNLFSVSPGTGGGFVDVEPGTGQSIMNVLKYKTQSGASIVTMLCRSDNSVKEQRFNLVENTISLSNEQSMKSWQAEQVAGAVGCESYNGAVVCEDGLYSVSRYGLALTTMTMEYNSQIRTTYVSDPIKPAFTDITGEMLHNASVLERDGIIYMALGKDNETLDNLLFCYDIDQKAWWTVTLDIDADILGLIHIDYTGKREGIGIITPRAIYMLPLTHDDSPEDEVLFLTTIQTGELSTTQPQQNWSYLSQLEFRFDYFIGTVIVSLTGIDQFGRKVTTKKQISHDSTVYNLAEYMRVDLRLQSYQIRIVGPARFRMTHFIAKVYAMSDKQGLVWGFDDSQSFRTDGDIHPTFKDYNDIRQAIIV